MLRGAGEEVMTIIILSLTLAFRSVAHSENVLLASQCVLCYVYLSGSIVLTAHDFGFAGRRLSWCSYAVMNDMFVLFKSLTPKNDSLVTKDDMVATGTFHLSMWTARVPFNCMSVFNTIGIMWHYVNVFSLSCSCGPYILHVIIAKTVWPENMQCKYMYHGWSHLARGYDDMLNRITAFWFVLICIYLCWYASQPPPSLPFLFIHIH